MTQQTTEATEETLQEMIDDRDIRVAIGSLP